MLFPYGLLSAGDVHDEVSDTGAVKRVGVADLGDFNYKVMDYSTSGYAWINEKNPDIDSPLSIDYKASACVCSKYPSALYGSDGRMEDKTIAVSKWTFAAGAINIKDSSMSGYTTEQVKAALKGVMLYYELATPITITFTSPKDLGYNVQSGGTEELLPTNPSGSGPITAPVLLSVNYPLDAVGTLTNLPRNYISVASMDSFTTALGNFLNANITRTWDATNEKYTFTVVSRT